MNIAVRLFLSSMVFSITIATIYGLTTHDLIGVVFLGIMALALAIVAGYIVVAEKEAYLAGDSQDAGPADVVGENLGEFTVESPVPIIAAIGTSALLTGLVFLPGTSLVMAFTGIMLIAWSTRYLVR